MQPVVMLLLRKRLDEIPIQINQIPRGKLRGYLPLVAFAICSCRHGPKSIELTWIIARGNEYDAVEVGVRVKT